MSRRLGAFMLLVAFSAPLLADDLRPGEWKITIHMEGEELPEVLTRPDTKRYCMNGDEARDLEATTRRIWSDAGCQDIEFTRQDNKMTGRATCHMDGREMIMSTRILLHGDEHFEFENRMINDGTVTTYHEGHWLASECSPDALPFSSE